MLTQCDWTHEMVKVYDNSGPCCCRSSVAQLVSPLLCARHDGRDAKMN